MKKMNNNITPVCQDTGRSDLTFITNEKNKRLLLSHYAEYPHLPVPVPGRQTGRFAGKREVILSLYLTGEDKNGTN
jgi:hypothetical protein